MSEPTAPYTTKLYAEHHRADAERLATALFRHKYLAISPRVAEAMWMAYSAEQWAARWMGMPEDDEDLLTAVLPYLQAHCNYPAPAAPEAPATGLLFAGEPDWLTTARRRAAKHPHAIASQGAVYDRNQLLAHADALTARLTAVREADELAWPAEGLSQHRFDQITDYREQCRAGLEMSDVGFAHEALDELLSSHAAYERALELMKARAERTEASRQETAEATRELSYERQMRQQTEEAMITLAARVKEQQQELADQEHAKMLLIQQTHRWSHAEKRDKARHEQEKSQLHEELRAALARWDGDGGAGALMSLADYFHEGGNRAAYLNIRAAGHNAGFCLDNGGADQIVPTTENCPLCGYFSPAAPELGDWQATPAPPAPPAPGAEGPRLCACGKECLSICSGICLDCAASI